MKSLVTREVVKYRVRLSHRGNKIPKRIQDSIRLKIVVGRLALQTILAPTREIPEFYRCFGIPGQTQDRLGFVRCLVDHFQFREDRIGFLDLFLGLHLATLVR